MDIAALYKTDYKITYLNCMRQYWRRGASWSCMGHPKERDLLFMPEGCRVVYTLSDGSTIHADSSDTVYIPRGSEYTVSFYDVEGDVASSVAINHIVDCPEHLRKGTITVCKSPDARAYFLEAERLINSASAVHASFAALIYNIVTAIGKALTEQHSPTGTAVSLALEYIHRHLGEDFTVGTLAKLSNVSEVYLRRIFKEKVGTSPLKYRNVQRIRRAAEYLMYSDSSVEDIADMLGFSDTSHFVRCFRSEYGTTPHSYRRKF